MNKIYIRYKILVNGLNVLDEYKIDGFTLKTGKFDESIFDHKYNYSSDYFDIDTSYYLKFCLINENELSFKYFIMDNYDEYTISNKITKINQYSLRKIMERNKEILQKVNKFECKLRIMFNIPILFQIINIEFYDSNKKYIATFQSNSNFFNWNRLDYNISKEEIYNNSRYKFNFEDMNNVKNNNFKRFLELYNTSFESDKISIRYILIFSSLEAIFNLDSNDVTDKIARYTAKLLSEYNNDKYQEIYDDMRKLYKKRCKYIHGAKINNILEEDEFRLRNYVRKILIIYWIIIRKAEKTPKEILKYLDSDEKLDINLRLIITTLNSNDFFEQQQNLINLLENEYSINIPENVKDKLLCKNNNTLK